MDRFSIIVPVKKINKNITKLVKEINYLTYRNFELIILPDSNSSKHLLPDSVKVVATGNIGPAQKRNIGAGYSTGNILAFLDDDSFPEERWLEKAIKDFKDLSTGAVCGPAITPKNSSLYEKASGRVLECLLVSGPYIYRYLPKRKRFVNDFPSVNLLIRKNVFFKVAGFSKDYWPGEDTIICREIEKAGYKLIYNPEVLVIHKRRRLFKGHLKQIAGYALHRGFFAKKYKSTSLKPSFFVPSIFTLYVFLLPLILFFPSFLNIYLYVLGVYLSLILISSLKSVLLDKSFKLIFLVAAGIFLTHITYGIYFIIGMLKKDLTL